MLDGGAVGQVVRLAIAVDAGAVIGRLELSVEAREIDDFDIFARLPLRVAPSPTAPPAELRSSRMRGPSARASNTTTTRSSRCSCCCSSA